MLLPEQPGALQDRKVELADGTSFRVVAGRSSLKDGERALKASGATLRNEPLGPTGFTWIGDLPRSAPEKVRDSYEGAFHLKQESEDGTISGLRLPQVGAVHSVLGYRTTGVMDPATLVMPTGTGKTETMLALLVAERLERLLVVVPSDALRTQIASKFHRLGVLQEAGVVDAGALRPVVGQIKHRFAGPDEAVEFARACNVLVTTPPALLGPKPEVVQALLAECSDLFVDEAHHVGAPTWRRLVDAFAGKPIVQFTATPYREDGKPLGGRLIYRLPLKRAQELEYFSEIDYASVVDFQDPHRALAGRAIKRLRADLAKGLDHVLMARVKWVARAEEIFAVYDELAPDLNPVVVHSHMGDRDRSERLERVRNGESQIVVCVDMLGEGFDMPQLKVAAIHDPHKSLGVTLQFVGRFARVAGPTIGKASVFVGPPERDYDERLRRLYAEDADWNRLIHELADEAVAEEAELEAFEAGFGARPDEVSMRSLAPKMSTVVYRTNCSDWNPTGILSIYDEDSLLSRPLPINEEAKVSWFVVEIRQPVRWGDLPMVEEIAYHLFVVYWDEHTGLLYINSSDKSGVHEALAKAICGSDVVLIKGDNVYRTMHNIQRLLPTNVGLLDVRNQNRRFTMLVGANVVEGLPASESETKAQTNIFASGFELGARTTIGASLKGRIWSYAAARSIKHWTEWCDHIGRKLTDSSISKAAVMANFIRPVELERRPELIPLAVEWPWETWIGPGSTRRVDYDNKSFPLLEAEMKVTRFEADGNLDLAVVAPEWEAPYRLDISKDGMRYVPLAGEVNIVLARGKELALSEYLRQAGTLILFEEDAVVIPPALLLKPEREPHPVDLDLLHPVAWDGINLSKESQGKDKDATSIQYRMLEEIRKERAWDLLIDDDTSGEIADIVAIRVSDDYLDVVLLHCKFAKTGAPAARVEDLYELCGQAQKSVRWRHYVPEMFQRLISREQRRVQTRGYSGLEIGDANDLYRLKDQGRRLRPRFRIALAQPGVTKSGISLPQQHLLGSTQNYVNDVAAASFAVYCSS
jgi:superfamily II DNA or RNA helicase